MRLTLEDKPARCTVTGSFRKAVVIGMLERKGEVRNAVLNRASGDCVVGLQVFASEAPQEKDT
jgi:hypothetical protein